MTTKTRWIQVRLKEGDSLADWSATELGETTMVQPVGGDLEALGRATETAAFQLLGRGRELVPMPPETEPQP